MSGFGKTKGDSPGGRAAVKPALSATGGAGARLMVSAPSSGSLGDRSMLLAIVAVMVAAGLAAFGVTAMFPQKAASASAPKGPPPAETELARHRELALVFRAVQEKFPNDYAELKRKTFGHLASGNVAEAGWQTLRLGSKILERDAPNTVEHADSAKLGEFMRRNVEFMIALQKKSPMLCAKAGLGSLDDERVKPLLADEAVLSAASRALIASFNAIEGGRRQPVKYAPPTPEQQAMLGRAVVQQGFNLSDAMTYKSGGMGRLPVERQCDLMVKGFRALLSTPEPARSRFIAQAAATATKGAKDGKDAKK